MADLDALLVGGFALALALVVIGWAAYLLGGDPDSDRDGDGDRFNW